MSDNKANKPQPIESEPRPTSWLNYHSSTYSHMTNRLPWQDIIARQIYLSGPEGIDRITISSQLGINGNTKYGNRKVTNYIHSLSKGLPDETGIFQKLTGKCRVLNFYHKSFEPMAFSGPVAEITKILGRECPFKLGDSISFPETKLSNMRVTDVMLRRMKVLIEAFQRNPAYPLRELSNLIQISDVEQGFDCQVDRRTMTKYAYALEKYGICKVHTCKVLEDETNDISDMMVLSRPDIVSNDDDRILQAISALKKSYNDQGRSFPHGQMKKFTVNHKTIEKPEKPSYSFELHNFVETKNDVKLRQQDFFQRKMIRAHLLHELIFRAVYHPDYETGPTYFDIFPNEDEPTPRNLEDMIVFDDEKDSFFRFVPPIKPHDGLLRGWFSLRMILRVMPLSIFVLCFNNISVNDDMIDYLNDPIKRHIILTDLPYDLRIRCINKKVWSYLDVLCTILCGMGLFNASPDSRRVYGPIGLFYCKKKWDLYDTSVVHKAYSMISEDPSEIPKYEYIFETVSDVERFWYHFRAIALSTPLNSRSEKNEKLGRNDRYTRDYCKKEDFTVPSFDDINWSSAALPGKGAGLVDFLLFSHLKRHWDMTAIDNPFVVWFSSKYVETGEQYRKYVEDNVANLNFRWLSTMQCLVPPPVIFNKKPEKRKITTTSDDETAGDINSSDNEEPEAKKVKIKTPKGKRQLDEEDIESANRLQSLRNRFSNRERDMFILLRAVSQFLNPVAKMWVDPRVVRRIMKAYFEESNDKTINAMTGASGRELGHRREDVWHLVRGLGSFAKMREIRDKSAVVLTEDFEKREEYFCQAFDIAYRLVTRDIPNLPSVFIDDKKFDKVLDLSNLTIGMAECPSENPIVTRLTSTPVNQEQLTDHLMHDWILNTVLAEWLGLHTPLTLAISSHKGSSLFHTYIEKMHEDGILTRAKLQSVGFRSRISPSSAFLGYFSHNIRSDIFSTIASLPDEFDQSVDDNFGVFLRLTNALMDKNAVFNVSIGTDTFASWQDFEHRRNLRDTESGALKLNYVVTSVDSNELGKVSVKIPEKFSEIQAAPLVDNMVSIESDDYVPSILSKCNQIVMNIAESIVQKVQHSGITGIPVREIVDFCQEMKMDKHDYTDLFANLENSYLIYKVGFDVPRYVCNKYIRDWSLPLNGRLLFVKPWTQPDGTINLQLFRWFTEMVFITIHESPCIDSNYLKNYFCGAIHSALLEEILEFLVDNKVIKMVVEEIETVEVKGPFSKVSKIEKKTYYKCDYRGFERFTLIFEGINLPEYNYSEVRKPFD